MDKITADIFIERVKQLPLDIKEGVLNVDFLEALRKVQEDNHLHIDQGASLEDLTFRVILGDIEESTYLRSLQSELAIDQVTALKIATEINENILNPIRAEIQDIEEQNEVLAATPQSKADNVADLTAEGILAGIEDPHPSVAVEHKTVVHSTPEPIKPTVTIPAGIPELQTPPQSPNLVTTPQAIPTPIATDTTQAAPFISYSSVVQNSVTPASTPSANPITKVSSALNSKLEQSITTKPIEIIHSIDPYKEPLE